MTIEEAAREATSQVFSGDGPGWFRARDIIARHMTALLAERESTRADIRRMAEWLNSGKSAAETFPSGPERELAEVIEPLRQNMRELQVALATAHLEIAVLTAMNAELTTALEDEIQKERAT